MKYFCIALFLFISTNTLYAQGDVETVEVVDDSELENIPFAVIEKVPVYPGCTGEDNRVLKKCMSDNIAAYVNENFDIKKASKGLPSGMYRVFVNFKIDKEGRITNVRSRGPNKKLEKEAIKVVKGLPKMIPGQQKGKNVGVLYALPIKFILDNSNANQKKKG